MLQQALDLTPSDSQNDSLNSSAMEELLVTNLVSKETWLALSLFNLNLTSRWNVLSQQHNLRFSNILWSSLISFHIFSRCGRSYCRVFYFFFLQKSRPLDISVRLKLLKCQERSQKFDVALEYVREVLWKSPYCDNFDWCNYTAELLKVTSSVFVYSSCDLCLICLLSLN